jgi:uncharacterized delta-60 repeat protein
MSQGRSQRRRRAARALAVVAAALLALLAVGGTANADGAPGLDPAFGTAGFATAPLTNTYGGGSVELGVAPDGSATLASAGGEQAIRFDAAGAENATFGGPEGVEPETLIPALKTKGVVFEPRATAVDSQGRALIFGETVDFSRSFTEGVAGEGHPSDAFIARLTPTGALDPSFGEGKGYVESSLGIPPHLESEFPTTGIMAATVDSRNRPVLLADVQDGSSGCYAHGGIGPKPVAVVRLTESGALDPSFGKGGRTRIEGSGSFVDPIIGLDAEDGPAVAVGRTGSYKGECGVGRFVYRLRADGSRLGSFGAKGLRSFQRLELDLVTPSGALILSRRHGSTLGIVRVRPNGDRDKAFGKAGVDAIHLSSRVDQEYGPVAVDSAGRIILAGAAGPPLKTPLPRRSRLNSLVVGRLLPDGRPDPTFGTKGTLYARIPGPPRVTDLRAALDPQGRLLVGATTIEAGEAAPGFLLARFLLG